MKHCDKCQHLHFEYWGNHTGFWCKLEGKKTELQEDKKIIMGDKVITPTWCSLKESEDE